METLVSSALRNDAFVFWMSVTLMVVVPSISWTIADAWRRNRQAERDANLKHRMLEMGMVAEEIERVVAARTCSDDDADDQNPVAEMWS